MPYADLELSLRRWSGDDDAVELRFQLADAGAEAHLIAGSPPACGSISRPSNSSRTTRTAMERQ
jgi:hypothetical protein